MEHWLKHNVPIKYRKKDTVKYFVLCNGKCGSTSLEASFSRCGETRRYHRKGTLEVYIGKPFPYDFIEYIKYTAVKEESVVFVNGSRDPIQRCISSFFENVYNKSRYKGNIPIKFPPISDIIRNFKENHLYRMEQYNSAEIWQHFGINIYDCPFNHEKGYNVYHKDNYVMLDLLFENIKDWDSIIREHTDCKKFTLVKHNHAGNKWYKELYQEFKSKITFTEAEMDRFCSLPFWQRYITYYYGPNGIDNLKRKWNQNKS